MRLRHPARRLAALALSLLLLLAFLPTAFAGGETVPAGEGQAPREGAVAQLGPAGETFDSVQEAIDAAAPSAGTVHLLQDVEECITISTGSVTLDLSGHTLSAGNDPTAQAVIHVKGGTLTIEDTAGNGKVSTSDGQMKALRIEKDSVTLDSGTLLGKDDSGTLVSIEGSSASLTVKDGAIRSEAQSGDNDMGMVQISKGCTLKLDGGELYSSFLHAIRNNGGGRVTMTGGSVTVDRQGAYALDNYGTAEISGGILTVQGGTAVHAVTNSSGPASTTKLSGSVVCNGNIHVNGSKNADKTNIANLEISSGTINGSVNVESYSEVTLSGGIYSQKLDDKLVGDALVILADSKYYVGEDAEKRISSAQSGDTLEVVHGDSVSISDLPGGVTVENKTEDNITVNGEPVAPDGSITIPAPEQPSEPSNPSFTEPSYYPDYDEDSLPPVDEETPEEARDLYMVTCRTLNVRLGGGTGYARIGTLSRGTILEGELENGWLKFAYNGQTAYCSADYLARVDGDLTDMHVTCRTLNVRAGAGTNFEILGTLSRGAEVEILDVLPGWYEIEHLGGEAYVSAAYIG
ncbi:MAG TPA: SH3 domain-containing protein [Candidatus Spyradocola merdavium]|nr:SH3 domain-containing protein [Candidatus Spyradocola merdavium]